MEGSSFGVTIFCLFIQFMGFSQQEYWSGLPFPPPADHVLSELSTMTRPSWVALLGMAHSFIELRKPLCYEKAVIDELGWHSGMSRNSCAEVKFLTSSCMAWGRGDSELLGLGHTSILRIRPDCPGKPVSTAQAALVPNRK